MRRRSACYRSAPESAASEHCSEKERAVEGDQRFPAPRHAIDQTHGKVLGGVCLLRGGSDRVWTPVLGDDEEDARQLRRIARVKVRHVVHAAGISASGNNRPSKDGAPSSFKGARDAWISSPSSREIVLSTGAHPTARKWLERNRASSESTTTSASTCGDRSLDRTTVEIANHAVKLLEDGAAFSLEQLFRSSAEIAHR